MVFNTLIFKNPLKKIVAESIKSKNIDISKNIDTDCGNNAGNF